MSWKQVRIFVLALIFGAVLVVLLKVILATLAEKGKGKSATRLPRVESMGLESVDIHKTVVGNMTGSKVNHLATLSPSEDMPYRDAAWKISIKN
jgi:hypothetical protein